MLNLKKLPKINDTFEIALDDEFGVPNGNHITVYGSDSSVYEKAMHKVKNKRFTSKKQATSQEIEASTMGVIIACIESWDIKDGKEIAEVNEENAKLIFESCPWIYEQVVVAVGDRNNFLASAPKS